MGNAATNPELLAPAGTLAMGVAAFDAGADAVYAGLARFNARERGSNLSVDDLARLIALARRLNRRAYITVNTLVKDSELPALRDMLTDLAILRPDAVIVQDIGVARLVRKQFPVLPLHASTQMAIHNSAGVSVAAEIGIRRVILERQLTFEEIRRIRAATDAELEVFAHGALCCSRSGCCLFSSWMGGWSGNRGRCKQPCRRRYHSEQGNGFFFSPGDLCSIDDVPRLRKLGVASLKIEGRLRQPDYVERVVRAYRMVLDAPDGDRRAVKKARAELSGALGRRWVGPFRRAEDLEDVVQHDRMGVSGLLCGTVTRSSRGGFMVKVIRPFKLGDVIRVQPRSGEEGPSFTITRLSVDRRAVTSATTGAMCWVHFDRDLPRGASVFLVSSPTGDISARLQKLPVAKPVLDLRIAAGRESVQIEVCGLDVRWTSDWSPEPAQTRELSADALAAEFARSGDGAFRAGNIEASLPPGLFLPASVLKALRRAFWSWVAKHVGEDALRASWTRPLPEPVAFEQPAAESVTYVAGASDTPETHGLVARCPADALKASHTDEVVLPDFCPEDGLDELRATIATLREKGVRRFRVTSLYGFALVAPGDSRITASFPLPLCNRLAFEEARQLGATKGQAWIELGREALQDMVAAGGAATEIFIYGRVPLLMSRFNVPVDGQITDGRGAAFTVEHEQGQAIVYPEKPLSLPPFPGASSFIDLTHAEPGEPSTTRFNYDHGML